MLPEATKRPLVKHHLPQAILAKSGRNVFAAGKN